MSSKIATVSAAVVAYLNAEARGYPMAFTAARRHVPRFDAEELKDLTVCVAGVGRTRQRASRAQFFKRIQVNVGILKRLTQGADPNGAAGLAEVDDLLELAEAVDDSFAGVELGGAQLDQDEPGTLAFNQKQLDEEKVFFAVVSLNFIYVES